jgi:hypothetical protein
MSELVEVLAPFDHTFGGVYEITELVIDGGETVAYILDDIGAFDAQYLKKAA